jgi:hypothetical protein
MDWYRMDHRADHGVCVQSPILTNNWGENMEDNTEETESIREKALEKWEQVKWHVREHRTAYISTGAVVIVGAGGVLVGRYLTPAQKAQVVQGIAYKSPVTQNVIQQSIPRAGHAGKVFLDRDDPTKFYMSERLLADALGVSRREVQRYQAGKIPNLAGRQFDLIMDGAPPLTAQLTVSG